MPMATFDLKLLLFSKLVQFPGKLKGKYFQATFNYPSNMQRRVLHRAIP